MRSMLRRTIVLTVVLLCSAGAWAQAAKPEMLLYCGITMVRPMTEIAQLFEKRENVRIAIAQGGSEDLYQSAKKSGVGDWYLPGEPSYRDKHLAEGLFGDQVTVGHNQMAMMVLKGNPKKVKADLHELLREDLAVVIGSPERGAIGLETQQILKQAGLFDKVVRGAAALAPDSRSLNLMLKRGEADVIVNFRATAYFPDNAAHMEALDLDPRIAKPQPLWLSLTTVAKNPRVARRFMQYAAGPEGQAIFRKYGFLDNQTPVRP